MPVPARPRLFPQPFRGSGRLEIDLDRPATLGITVYDLLGRYARALPARQAGPGTATLPVELPGLPRGIYLLEAAAGGEIAGRLLFAAP
jgi:hypothetical protein